jgi:hypothetical protein
MNPADAPLRDLSEDEAEAFIGQEGTDAFDGVIIDDLDGEGACCYQRDIVLLLLLLLLLLLRLLLPDAHDLYLWLAGSACLQACQKMKRAVEGMRMERQELQKTTLWRMNRCRRLKGMEVGAHAPWQLSTSASLPPACL